MKKLILKCILLLGCTVFLVCTCTKNENKVIDGAENGNPISAGETTENGVDEQPAPEGNIAETNAGTTGVVYVNEATLYVENEDGKMKWAKSAVLGDVATYLGEKKAASRTDGQKRDFFHISIKGEDYWIQDYCFEPNTEAAFISQPDTILYKADSLTGATDEILPQYLIVAVYTDSLTAENEKFVKIAAYSSDLLSWIVKGKFVKRENIERNPNDVNAMMIAQIASQSKNDTIRAELFQNAIEMNSIYSNDIANIQALTEARLKEDAFLAKLPMEKIEEKVVLNADTTLFSIPSTTDARTLETVKEGTKAVAYKKVSLDEGGKSVDWYYIESKQKKGWVQASSLEIKETF